MKKIISFLLFVSVLQFRSSLVLAQTAEQDQEFEQTTKVTCVTGSYGTSSSCTTELEQRAKQSQKIAYLDNGTAVVSHKVVDTSIPQSLNFIILVVLASATTISFFRIQKK